MFHIYLTSTEKRSKKHQKSLLTLRMFKLKLFKILMSTLHILGYSLEDFTTFKLYVVQSWHLATYNAWSKKIQVHDPLTPR